MNRFSTRYRHGAELGRRPATSPEADHEWIGVDERFCAHHADAGARALADLLGTSPLDVIRHMGSLGVDVPPVPLLGDACPVCGRRMPVTGHAAANGVCDACYARVNRELRAVRRAEREASREADLEAHRNLRGGA